MYFILEVATGRLQCFKKPTSSRAKKTYSLIGGHVQETEKIVRDVYGPVVCFEFVTQKKVNLLVIPELGTSIEDLRNCFEICANLPLPKKKGIGKKMKGGVLTVLKAPWKAGNLVIVSLEKISAGAKATPDYLFRQKRITPPKEAPPSNLASGLFRGTGALIKGILSAIAGLFVEPYKGAKRGGFKGGMVGMGKGLVGLVCKPVAGTLDLISLTARGLGNTPKTMYMSIGKIVKKRKKFNKSFTPILPYYAQKNSGTTSNPETENNMEENLAYIGELENEEIYLDRDIVQRKFVKAFEIEKESAEDPSANDSDEEILIKLNNGRIIENFPDQEEKYRIFKILKTQLKMRRNRYKGVKANELERENLLESIRESLEVLEEGEKKKRDENVNVVEEENKEMRIEIEEEGEEEEKWSEVAKQDGGKFKFEYEPPYEEEKVPRHSEVQAQDLYVQDMDYCYESDQSNFSDTEIQLGLEQIQHTGFITPEQKENYKTSLQQYLEEMYEENFNHAIEEFFQLETDNYKEILEESKIEVYYITAHSQGNSDESYGEEDEVDYEYEVNLAQVKQRQFETMLVRNPKNRAPPCLHNHHIRNPFLKTFSKEENEELTKALEKELKEETVFKNMVIRKKLEADAQIEEEDLMKSSSVIVRRNDSLIESVKQSLLSSDSICSSVKSLEIIARKKSHELSSAAKFILQRAKNFMISKRSDDYRLPSGNTKGGLNCMDQATMKKLRGVVKEVFKSIGKRIFKGKFNLTQISFPIKCMCPMSILQTFAASATLNPIFMNKAAFMTDPIEKFKYAIVATFASFHITSRFLKPLNPILGETFTACFEDGSKYYSEQTSHHPPISHFQLYGPEENYIWTGNFNFEAHAKLNSIYVNTKGMKHIHFKDGTHITYNSPDERFANTFFGNLKHETLGKIQYIDHTHNLVASISLDSVKKKPTDYLSGNMTSNGNHVCDIFGTYIGFIEFDSIRYWDVRDQIGFNYIPTEVYLPSDCRNRIDYITLAEGDVDQAQKNKEALEMIQRTDAKLRLAHQKQIKSASKKQK